jgi:serine/threonine protein kinase
MIAGDTVGSYRILDKLGEGGMGTVYLAEHTLLGRRAAIKVLLPELSRSAEIVQRFFNEARAVTQIADPGIVQVFDFGHHTDGSAFIVMELLDGEPMDRRLARLGRMSVPETLRTMRLACASLAVAHAKGIVHRDLKPENIFIVGDAAVSGGERPKLLDFGIAKLSSEEPGSIKTRTGVMMGTPVYMSPEQCRGAADVDHRSDIYAMGCVMFSMLTGRPPFEGQASGDLIAMHILEPAPLAASRVSHVPPQLDEILQRCLRKSPAERYPSMLALVEALDVMIDQGVSARSSVEHVALQPTIVRASMPTTLSGASGQTELPRRSGSARWIAVSALLVAIAAVSVVLSLQRSPAPPPRTIAAAPSEAAVPIDAAIDASADAAIDAASIDAAPIDDAARVKHAAPRRSDNPLKPEPTHEAAPYDRLD